MFELANLSALRNRDENVALVIDAISKGLIEAREFSYQPARRKCEGVDVPVGRVGNVKQSRLLRSPV